MVEVVGDVDVAGCVQRHAVGEAELARSRPVRASSLQEVARRVERLEAVVVVVGDDHLAFVRRDAAGVGELAGAAAV